MIANLKSQTQCTVTCRRPSGVVANAVVGWWEIVVVTRIHRVSLVVCELIGHLSNHRIPLGCAGCAIALPALGRKTPWISGSQLRSPLGTRPSPMGEDRRVFDRGHTLQNLPRAAGDVRWELGTSAAAHGYSLSGPWSVPPDFKLTHRAEYMLQR